MLFSPFTISLIGLYYVMVLTIKNCNLQGYQIKTIKRFLVVLEKGGISNQMNKKKKHKKILK